MRAAVLSSASEKLEVVDDVEVEEPGPGEVAVRVSHCGVCHSDLSVVDGQVPALTPVVLGHEAAGVVEAVGPGVTRVAVGDHVVLTPCPPCGHCYWCLRGEHSICTNSLALMTGAHPDGGTRLRRHDATVYRGLGVAAFAEVVVTQESGAVKIPDDVPLEVACVIGCAVQTGVGAVLNTAGVRPGDTVAVLGLGGVGLSVVQGARVAAATTIIASDPVAERRELALRLGATHVVDPTAEDLPSRVQAITGVGVDVAFDAAGRVSLVNDALAATRSGGLAVMVGVPPLGEPLVIDLPALFAFSEKKLVGCLLGGVNSPRDIPRLVELWRVGRLDLEALITSRRPLAEINEAFDDLRASRGVRTVLTI